MGNNTKFKYTFSKIMDSMEYFQQVDNDKEMNKVYIDEYTTYQQRLRDKKITELLTRYVESYIYKNKSNKWYKRILFGICGVILLVFSGVFIYFILNTRLETNSESIGNMVQIISVCITFLTLIIGILQIITKYVFPEKEEEYITRIVEIIQNNDLENKKENILVKTHIQECLNKENKKEIEGL